jgi:hypothetical protein
VLAVRSYCEYRLMIHGCCFEHDAHSLLPSCFRLWLAGSHCLMHALPEAAAIPTANSAVINQIYH